MSSPKQESEDMEAGDKVAEKTGEIQEQNGSSHAGSVATKQSVQAALVGGAFAQNYKDITAEAVKVAHEKPMPTVIKPVMNKQMNRTIHQPR